MNRIETSKQSLCAPEHNVPCLWSNLMMALLKLQNFIYRCVCNILHMKWLDRATNGEVWRRAGKDSLDCQTKGLKRSRLGHTLRKPPSSVVPHDHTLDPRRKRRRGKPRNDMEAIHRSRRVADGIFMRTCEDVIL